MSNEKRIQLTCEKCGKLVNMFDDYESDNAESFKHVCNSKFVVNNNFIVGDNKIRVKRNLNPDGCYGGYVSIDANVSPIVFIKDDDLVLTSKQFETHQHMFNDLVSMCDKHELGRVLYNEGDNVVVMYP